MVRDPLRWLPVALAIHARRVAFHVEAIQNVRPLIGILRAHRIAAIAAINPRTPLARLFPLARAIQGVLLLGVTPGPSGSRFYPSVIPRVRTLRKRFRWMELSVDGGVSGRTITSLVSAGANRLVVGSALFDAPDPIAAFRSLQRQLV